MKLWNPQIVFSVLFIALVSSTVSAERKKVPDLQVYVYVSDGSFSCSWCDKFKAEVLSNWKKQGWPIGTGKTNHIRIIPCVSGPVPYFEIYRKGERTAKHAGYLDRAAFRAFTAKHLPEWYEKEKREAEQESRKPEQKLIGTPTPPKYWNYKSQLLLGN